MQAILTELDEAPEQEGARLLEERCAEDRELRDEVESLLAASADAVARDPRWSGPVGSGA